MDPLDPDPLAFHRTLPGYAATPLVSMPALAARLGVAAIHVKDESSRLGLPSFKVLGASWAAYRALTARFGRTDPDEPVELITATEGNHGRAVARVAAWFDLAARIFVPADMTPLRQAAIESEGATVVRVDGGYDDAVERAGREAGDRAMLIQDTGWPGYEEVPGWVIDGYSTLLRETDRQLADDGLPPPDLVLVQIGVGSLASSVVRHFRAAGREHPARVVGVEPVDAACALDALRAGQVTTLPGPHRSMMAGLNCGRIASLALPWLTRGLSAVVTVEDEQVATTMCELAAAGIISGASGAAGLAGLLEHATHLGIGPRSRILALSTEGATDPELHRRVTRGASR